MVSVRRPRLAVNSFTIFLCALCVLGALCVIPSARAQDNYEIQVYGSDLVDPGHTMVELHSNFTFQGSKSIQDGMLPTNHQLHETVEITHGFNDWFECGFYIFTAEHNSQGIDWVGDHIRPRVAIPKKWKWPVGLSLSNEVGYQRRQFSSDSWTWEMRPIIDKQAGPWYFSFNPTFDKSIHGMTESQGFVFSPNVKVSYDFTKKITGGFEYYGSVGPATEFLPGQLQQHQFLPAIDLNLSPKWEVNFGVGVDVTNFTDHLIAKMILGYRFDF
jgi:hypothetical protein